MSDFQFVVNDEYHLGVILGDDTPTLSEIYQATPLGKTPVMIQCDGSPFIWDIELEDSELVDDHDLTQSELVTYYDAAVCQFVYNHDKDREGFNLWSFFGLLFSSLRNWLRGLK